MLLGVTALLFCSNNSSMQAWNHERNSDNCYFTICDLLLDAVCEMKNSRTTLICDHSKLCSKNFPAFSAPKAQIFFLSGGHPFCGRADKISRNYVIPIIQVDLQFP